MSIISIEFILFLLICLILYYIIPQKFRWILLLIASYTFYTYGGFKTVGYLITTTLSTYFAGILLNAKNKQIKEEKNDSKKLDSLKKSKKLIVALTCLFNFGLLFFIKYWDSFADFINRTIFKNDISNDLASLSTTFPRFNLLLPLGISFFIFQSIGYIIDVYRNKIPAEKNYLKYSLFVSFFPQLTQGPISRYNDLSPQLLKGNNFDFKNMEDGIKLLLFGFFKKLLIADRAFVVVDNIFNNYLNYNGSIIFIGVVLYCIQLFCDFSGGIDIIRGSAKLFGITMTENFKRPIFAKSLADFWRRWHISLGSWMKDYVFYPLSLSKPFIKLGKSIRKHIKGKAGQIIPVSIVTFIVYFLIGIWHGASFKYIAFGIWNGTLITLALLLEPLFTKIKQSLKINDKSSLYSAFQIIRTSFLVLIGRYITRAGNLGTALDMLKITFTKFNISDLTNGILLRMGLNLEDYLIILIGIATIIIIEAFYEKDIDLFDILKKSPVAIQFALTISFIVIIFVFGIYRGDYIASEFIYKQF